MSHKNQTMFQNVERSNEQRTLKLCSEKNLYPILRPLDIFSKTFSAIPPPQNSANLELTPAESSQHDVLLGAMTTSPSESGAIAPQPRLSEGVDFFWDIHDDLVADCSRL